MYKHGLTLAESKKIYWGCCHGQNSKGETQSLEVCKQRLDEWSMNKGKEQINSQSLQRVKIYLFIHSESALVGLFWFLDKWK